MLYTLYDVILSEPSISFSVISWLVTITVTMSSDVTDLWQCDHDITLTLTLYFRKKKSNENENEILNEKTSIQALYI